MEPQTKDASTTARRRLDVPVIIGLGVTGAIPATLAVFRFYGPAVEFLLWTVLALAVWIPVAARRAVRGRILHMLLVGAVAGLVTGLIQAPLADVMIDRDPALAETYGSEVSLAVRAQIFAIDLAIGITWGLLVGSSWSGAVAIYDTWNKKRGVRDAS